MTSRLIVIIKESNKQSQELDLLYKLEYGNLLKTEIFYVILFKK